jgi:hypothetical protein
MGRGMSGRCFKGSKETFEGPGDDMFTVKIMVMLS